MKYLLSLSVAASLLLANLAEAVWQPTQDQSWNIAFKNFNPDKEKAEIVEIDCDISQSVINKLISKNKKVICYISGGTSEEWRPTHKDFKNAGLLKNEYSGWPGEYWIDYRKSGYKEIMKKRMNICKKKGCHGLDIDNIDGYQVKDVKNNWTNPLTKDDAIALTKWLGKTAQELGISIGLKNGLDIVDEVGQYYQYAINEDCVRKKECHYYKNFLKTGKPVFSISYNGLKNNKKNLCSHLNGLPISVIIKEGEQLVQPFTAFDGKKHCGSNFKSGKVSPPAAKKPATNKVNPGAKNVPVNGAINGVKNIPGTKTTPTTGAPIVNSIAKNPNKDAANNNNNNNNNNNEIKDQYNEEKKNGNGKLITGFAISSSLCAVAAFAFIKRNPNKYENLKRNISRRATSVKRGASSIGRRLTTRGRPSI